MGAVYSKRGIMERRRIERWRHAKLPADEMARVPGRCRSTIFRALKRNRFSDASLPKCDGSYGAAAHLMTAHRRARDRKLIRYADPCGRVIERLKNGWTPEQIRNRMIHERARLREGMRNDLWWYPPTHRVARRPRRSRQRREPRFHRDVSILFRPNDVAHRRRFGHREADLMLFKLKPGQTYVTSLVERASRYTVILKNPNKCTRPVIGRIMQAIMDLPLVARWSITFDRGTEFVNWPHTQAETGTRPGSATPPPPGKKAPSSTNRKLRRWLPRKRDIRAMSDHDLKQICARLNNTLRKCLGCETPPKSSTKR